MLNMLAIFSLQTAQARYPQTTHGESSGAVKKGAIHHTPNGRIEAQET